MAHSPEDDALSTDNLTGSEVNLTAPASPPRGGSNSRALKIAGLTTLACLLVCSQVFTAYIVFDQRQQLKTLQKDSNKLTRDLSRASQVRTPMKLQMPMNSLLMNLDTELDPTTPKQPQTKQQDTAAVNAEKQLMDVMQKLNLPWFNETLLANMQCLKNQMNESEWKGFEAWIRSLLNFHRSQQKPVPPPSKPDFPVIKTKCQIEATTGVGKFGSFKPQCDEQGHYHPMQCWHATGYCWCVDETGTVIKDTISRQRPQCNALRRAAPADVMPILSELQS